MTLHRVHVTVRCPVRKRVFLLATLMLAGCREAPGTETRTTGLPPEESRVSRTYAMREVASSRAVDFASISSLGVDSRGRIYVGDPMSAHVVMLSVDGEKLDEVGRKGSGPGEFQSVDEVQLLAGDSLLVYDLQSARVTTFAPGGREVVGITSVRAAGSPAPPSFVYRRGARSEILAAYPPVFGMGGVPGESAPQAEVLRLLGFTGQVTRDSLLVVPSREVLVSRSGPGFSVRVHPFGRRSILRVGPGDRLHHAWTDSLSVTIYSMEGKRVGGFSAPYVAPRVTPQDIEAAAGKGGASMARELTDAAPERWPAIRDLIVDDHSRIWVALASAPGNSVEWLVLDESGRYVGSVRLPSNVQLRCVRGGRAYAVVTDENDVPRIVVYAVDRRLA